jgi:hypothetical protein
VLLSREIIIARTEWCSLLPPSGSTQCYWASVRLLLVPFLSTDLFKILVSGCVSYLRRYGLGAYASPVNLHGGVLCINNSRSGSICPGRSRDRVDLTSSSRTRVALEETLWHSFHGMWLILERSERTMEGLPNFVLWAGNYWLD